VESDFIEWEALEMEKKYWLALSKEFQSGQLKDTPMRRQIYVYADRTL
jgi:hypothetical protein